MLRTIFWNSDEAQYGPEAGLLALIACLVGSALVVGWVRLLRGRLALRVEIAAPPRAASSLAAHQ